MNKLLVNFIVNQGSFSYWKNDNDKNNIDFKYNISERAFPEVSENIQFIGIYVKPCALKS